jgi:hypothetical protein
VLLDSMEWELDLDQLDVTRSSAFSVMVSDLVEQVGLGAESPATSVHCRLLSCSSSSNADHFMMLRGLGISQSSLAADGTRPSTPTLSIYGVRGANNLNSTCHALEKQGRDRHIFEILLARSSRDQITLDIDRYLNAGREHTSSKQPRVVLDGSSSPGP